VATGAVAVTTAAPPPCVELEEKLRTVEPVHYLVTRTCRRGYRTPVAAYAIQLCREGDNTLFRCVSAVLAAGGLPAYMKLYLYAWLRWPEASLEVYTSDKLRDTKCAAHIFFLKWLYRKGIIEVPTCDELNREKNNN